MSTKQPTIPTKGFFAQPCERFLNRELSWLQFNYRVLEEAFNEHHPLLERVKFLSISSSNLDEFYMVRVAGLKDQVKRNVQKRSPDGLTPKQQLDAIKKESEALILKQQDCLLTLRKELKKERISLLAAADLTPHDKQWLEEHFFHHIFPALSPLAIDPAHPFPFLPNLSLTIIMQVEMGNQKLRAVLPLPSKLPRFIRLKNTDDDCRFILLEEAIILFKESLFPGAEVSKCNILRVTRDSDLEIEDEAEDLVQNFESAVKKRRRGNVIRLRCSSELPKSLRTFILKQLEVKEEDVVESMEMPGLSSLIELYDCNRPDLKFGAYEPRFPERINDYGGDCLAAIAAKDIVVHHPFESFDVVVSFLEQAAKDPDVIAIKQTLYRTSNESPIVRALIEAAEAGKSVTAVVELKARFEEEANIRWARDLERAGAQVVFGFVQLKTHAKLSLVLRREKDQLRSYVHFGTGNYHPVTAKVYSDLSFFTCKPELCSDANQVFNYLTGYLPPQNLHGLAMSPLNMRSRIIELIEDEMAHAKQGKPATIWAKMNALVDTEIIDTLYRASQAGVSIELVIRGICSLRPGIKGLSENIRVKSIVGRFLEHSRIMCFGNGEELPSKDAKVFITSADWMPRNFDHRIETLVPITNPTVHAQIMDQIMVSNLKDKAQSWDMQSDGSYRRQSNENNEFCAHRYFMNNPSLSGRGKAISEDARAQLKIYQPLVPKKS